MIGTDTISRVIGQDVYDESGEKIGSAAEVYLDDETGQPEWVTVRTGLFGTKESFVPIRERRPDRRRRPRTREQGPGEGRPEDRHRRPPVAAGGAGALPVLRHGHRHGHRHGRPARPTRPARHRHRHRHGRTPTPTPHGTVGHDTSGPTTDDAMTRSEERLDVGTRSEEVGRARLRKYVVTRERHRDRARHPRGGPRRARAHHRRQRRQRAWTAPRSPRRSTRSTLHAERAVVEKEAVPVERVRLDKDDGHRAGAVTEGLRKEEIEVDGVDTTRDAPRDRDRRI